MKTVHSAIGLWAYPPASPEPVRHSFDGKPRFLRSSLQSAVERLISKSVGGQEASKIIPLRSLGGISLRYHLSETGIASKQENMK